MLRWRQYCWVSFPCTSQGSFTRRRTTINGGEDELEILGRETQGPSPRARLFLAIIAIALAASTGFALVALHIINIGPSGPPHFTIIITSQGFNDSGTRDPWPVMNVAKNQTVTIHVVNQDTGEPHGFAISHYFDRGVTLSPGASYDLRFNATQAGSFLVYCNIFCSVHPKMVHGQLNVA